METLRLILNILLIAASLVVITVVLMQKSKSSGLGSAFGGDTQLLGARGKAASKEAKLQKITIAGSVFIALLAIVMMVIA